MTLPEQPYLVDKPVGATPLEALDVLRRTFPELAQSKLAYAGRLDPMASGLLVVIGEPLLVRQEEFWHLNKEYKASVVLGIETDSYDLLGLARMPESVAVGSERILNAASGLVGKLHLPVPVFSSSRFNGKPLFAWAKEQPSASVEIPIRRMAVHEIQVDDIATIDASALGDRVRARVPLVLGDFRQSAIVECWERQLTAASDAVWPMIRLRVSCAGGTYVRSLAHELGRRLGTGAFLAGLRRTKVADWSVNDPRVIHLK